MGTIDHLGPEQFLQRDIGVPTFEFDDFADLGQLLHDERRIRVAVAMDEGEDLLSLVPTILLRQPTWGFRQEHETEVQADGGDHLQSPRQAECSSSINEARTVADEEHNANTPSDGPLLHADKTASFRRRGDLGDVDGDLSGADTDGEAVDYAANDQHRDVLGSTDENATNDPEFDKSLDLGAK